MRPAARFSPSVSQALAGATITALIAVSIPALNTAPRAASFQSSQSQEPIIIGVVVLAEVPREQETSGSVVEDPKAYEGIPGLRVVTVAVPNAQEATGATAGTASLEGIVVDVGDGREQPATGPLTWVPRLNQTELILRILLHDRPEQPLATPRIPLVEMPATDTPKPGEEQFPRAGDPRHSGVTMPPVAVAGGVQVIHGDTSGNSGLMRLTVDGQPAKIVAAKPGTVFWRVPNAIAPGAHEVLFTPGPNRAPIRMRMTVLGLQMQAERTQLLRGQSTRMYVTVSGLESLPAGAWQSAAPAPPELVDLKRLQQLATAFTLPKPSDPGMVLLVLENRSPAIIRMGGRGDRIVLELHEKDVRKGPYTYRETLRSLQAGAFDIRGTLTAFLKPVTGRPSD